MVEAFFSAMSEMKLVHKSKKILPPRRRVNAELAQRFAQRFSAKPLRLGGKFLKLLKNNLL
jgi:hypothetical protein